MNHFDKIDVRVFDKFIDKFAALYIEQRTEFCGNLDKEVLLQAESIGCDFDVNNLLNIIKQNSIARDFKREKEETPAILTDIYRSDLGELLTTYYFEEKVDKDRRFLIPLKNITYRERPDMPGKGIDTIGYRSEGNKIKVLIAEAKVSSQKKSPPDVVDSKKDSIYKTHKKHHDDEGLILERLTDYLRRLPSSDHFMAIAGVAVNMRAGKKDKYDITYGCGLVRDSKCVDEVNDFGKMKSMEHDFTPGMIDFVIFSFTEKDIDETVDLFYQKVQELVR